VVGEQLRELRTALTRRAFEPRGDVRVGVDPIAPWQRFVRDVARQDVLEDVFALTGERRPRPREHELPIVQTAERSVGVDGRHARELDHRPRPEHPPDDGSRLEQALVVRLQQIDT